MVAWHPSTAWGRIAVDAERLTQPVPAALGHRWGTGPGPFPTAFWRWWTQAEVLAKLHDIPILTWLDRYGLDPAGRPEEAAALVVSANLTTWQVEDFVVSTGARGSG